MTVPSSKCSMKATFLARFRIVTHVVVPVTRVIDTVVHHVAEEPMKDTKTTFIARVRRFKSKMPRLLPAMNKRATRAIAILCAIVACTSLFAVEVLTASVPELRFLVVIVYRPTPANIPSGPSLKA